MNRLLCLTTSLVILLGFTNASAGAFDLFKAKDKHYDVDVAACWNAVSTTISEKNRQISYFEIDHTGPNPNTGFRSILFKHPYAYDTRGCIFESNGTIQRIIGLPR